MTRRNQRSKNTIRQGRLGLLDDTKKTQVLQIELMDDEVVEDVERLQNYGFTSQPEAGGVYATAIGGKGNQLAVVCINDDGHRVELGEGWAVAMYHKEGHKLVLSKDGVATLTCKKFVVDAEDKIEFNTKEFAVNAETAINFDTADFTSKASGSTTLDTPTTTTTGDTSVQGQLTYGNGLAGNGGENGSTVTGDLHITGTSKADIDHVSNGVSGANHTHGGIEEGGGDTEEPNK